MTPTRDSPHAARPREQVGFPPARYRIADGALVIRCPLPGRSGFRIENHRLVGIGAAINGMDAAQAPGRARRLLPVCGWAQGIACRRAVEAATGTAPDTRSETARDLLLLAEAAFSQVWRISIDWPQVQGCASRPQPVRQARHRLDAVAAALWGGKDPLGPVSAARPVATASADLGALADALDGTLDGVPDAPDQVPIWALTSSHPLASLVRRADALLPGRGLPDGAPPPLAAVAACLVASEAFQSAPDMNGAPAESAGLDALPISERGACAGFGPLAARFMAMLFAMRKTAQVLRTPDRVAASPAAVSLPDDWGAGLAQTARGALVHALRVEDGRIAAFRSVAPTEWVLHPRGALMRCLDRLADPADASGVRLAMAAFDPCAPVLIAPRSPAHA